MKKILLLVSLFAATNSFGQLKETNVKLDTVIVTATRADGKTPITHSNLTKEKISKFNYGQDLPFLLLTTPSVVVTSDAGAGIGYTAIRIRGTDPSRINVTANDIPMADAESHSLFWVNLPDFASSLTDIQVQRGVGSSTNGSGAFGGSINMKTAAPESTPYVETSLGYGSFNTSREIVKLGTGLLKNHFVFDARLSNLHSDGYIDRASTNLKSYFVQGAYYGKKNSIRFITFSGNERTYHAWNGIDKETLETNRRYNPSGAIEDKDGNVIGFYKNQTDNYNQTHYQLLYNQELAQRWSLNINLHYTDGRGYYEEYKNKRTLSEYGLTPFMADGELVKKSNLVRKKNMANNFGGGVFSVRYQSEKFDFTLGGAASIYDGTHWGDVLWVQNYVGNWQPDHEYYRNWSIKKDANIYAKANYTVAKGLSIYADLQYRFINHTIHGVNDNWDFNNGQMQALKVNNFYNFFNPKAGLFYQINDKNSVYGSFAVAHKEPTRNNYTDAKTDIKPLAERLYDTELGYNFRSRVFSGSATLYYMDYKDQLVLTGRTNEIGEPMSENVKSSYRAGLELVAGVQFTPWLRLDVNGTLSRNRIKNYVEYLDNVDANYEPLYTQTPIDMGETTISFSPSVTAGYLASVNLKGWYAALGGQYVGKQYMTNSMIDEASLKAYFVNNLQVSYSFNVPFLKRLTLGLSVNNIFDTKYESNGGGGSSYVIGADGKGERSSYAWYFPQAGINVMSNLTIRF